MADHDQDQLRLRMQMEEEEAAGEPGNPGHDPYKDGPNAHVPRVSPIPVSRPKSAEQLTHDKQAFAAEMSHGRSLAHMPEAEREKFDERSNYGALAEILSILRGAPFVGKHLDEISGAMQSGSMSGPEYEKKRDLARQTLDAADAHSPWGNLIGSVALMPSMPQSAAGRVGLTTAMGASEGAGAAPTLKDVPRDAVVGGAVGFGTGLLGEGLRGGGEYMGSKRGAVEQRVRDEAAVSADKAHASGLGALRQKYADANRTLEVLGADAEAVDLNPELVRAAKERLASDSARSLREQRLMGYLERFDDIEPAIADARKGLGELSAARSDDAVNAAAQARLDDPSALLRRARDLGPKVVLPIVGGALGGSVGAGAGALASSAAGRPGTTLRNALMDPYVSSRVYGAGEKVLGGAGAAAQSSVASKALLQKYLDLLREQEDK